MKDAYNQIYLKLEINMLLKSHYSTKRRLPDIRLLMIRVRKQDVRATMLVHISVKSSLKPLYTP